MYVDKLKNKRKVKLVEEKLRAFDRNFYWGLWFLYTACLRGSFTPSLKLMKSMYTYLDALCGLIYFYCFACHSLGLSIL